MDRRQFLAGTAAAAALAALPREAPAQPPAARSPGEAAIWVDAQGGIDGWDEPKPGRYVPSTRLIEAIGSGGSTWSA